MDATDVVEITQVLGRYGQIVDGRAWGDLADVFTPDAVFDTGGFGQGCQTGVEAIRTMFEGGTQPYSVNIVNIVVSDGDAPGTARAYSKNIGLLPKGRVGSASYHDELVRTAGGWRVARRTAHAPRREQP
ncbi:nuclear transport factor 2 family protein [Frankia sp. Cas3]|uniref:nuclear transport factor 2 family protein n=1 Tax=Frankia sp. Cas3 TaxID=3073926 RepID=UPI002AD2E00C|nr:nuclear transport factor 2 family protein [Frankia sp. Cas3]